MMNEVRKTHEESPATRTYVAPHARVVHFQSEGVLCASVMGIFHEGFEIDETYELKHGGHEHEKIIISLYSHYGYRFLC